MLIPLAVDLFIKACYADSAASLQPMMFQTSSTALMILIVLMLVLNFDNLISVIGTGAMIVLTFRQRWWWRRKTSETLT